MNKIVLMSIALLTVSLAKAQFTGPSSVQESITVADALTARVGSYVWVEGTIKEHLREEYYTFRDDTGEIRVEIEPELWQNRKIGPTQRIRLRAEVDRNIAGRYLWVTKMVLVEKE